MTRPSGSPPHLAGGQPADAEDFLLSRRYHLVAPYLPENGTRLLDFGCGSGAQTLHFARDFERIVGVDVDAGFLREFAVEIVRRDLTGHILPVQYDGTHLPCADGSVDCVVSFEVLEHVTDEQAALSEMYRVLCPGGVLVMSVPNRWWIFETHGANLPLLPWNRVPFFSWLPKHIHDRFARARIYRKREIVSMLERSGFHCDHSCYITAPMDVVPWPALRNFLRATVFRSDSTVLPVLATAVLVVARRP